MTTTLDNLASIDVSWTTPSEISAAGATTWDYIRIYRSNNENSGYQLVQTLDVTTGTACTFSATPTNTINQPGTSFTAGSLVGFSSSGLVPSPLIASNVYYVVHAATNTFQVANIPGGTALALASAGTGAAQSYSGLYKSQFASQASGSWVTLWTDTTVPLSDKDGYFYLVRYYNSATDTESKFYLTFKALNPRELRLVTMLKSWITPWVSSIITDDDLRAGLVLGLNALNLYPPTTSFTVSNCPTAMEPLWVTGSAIFTLMYKYLGVAFTDLSYSDNGLTLTVDRGAKMKTASDAALAYYNQLLSLVKMDYAYGGSGVGTISMPLSLGGKLSANLLSILDMFQATGR